MIKNNKYWRTWIFTKINEIKTRFSFNWLDVTFGSIVKFHWILWTNNMLLCNWMPNQRHARYSVLKAKDTLKIIRQNMKWCAWTSIYSCRLSMIIFSCGLSSIIIYRQLDANKKFCVHNRQPPNMYHFPIGRAACPSSLKDSINWISKNTNELWSTFMVNHCFT